jgi:hypothetical protein
MRSEAFRRLVISLNLCSQRRSVAAALRKEVLWAAADPLRTSPESWSPTPIFGPMVPGDIKERLF